MLSYKVDNRPLAHRNAQFAKVNDPKVQSILLYICGCILSQKYALCNWIFSENLSWRMAQWLLHVLLPSQLNQINYSSKQSQIITNNNQNHITTNNNSSLINHNNNQTISVTTTTKTISTTTTMATPFRKTQNWYFACEHHDDPGLDWVQPLW